jgi:hypothetical protein
MSLFSRIVKKIARRFRRKGTTSAKINQPSRNFKPETAVDLWERSFRFKETPAKRDGSKRAEARLALKPKWRKAA